MKKLFVILSLLIAIFAVHAIGLKGERYAIEGIELYQRGDYSRAINSFVAANNAADGSVPEYFYWLSKLYIAQADTVKANQWIQKYLNSAEKTHRPEVLAYQEILARQGLIFEEISLRNMPSYLGSRNSDYGAIPDPAGKYLYFVSMRPARYEKENIYRAEKLNNTWGKPTLLIDLSTDKNEAIGSFSTDGKTAYLSGNYAPGKIDGDIYYSEYRNRWHPPIPIDAVNTSDIELHPMVYGDSLMFFTSSRPGGIGGMDIYVSEYKNGSWQLPINLGATINTAKNEQTPFLDWDGKTLFFASDGHPGFGGYDIFKAVKIGPNWTDWSIPENLGIPMNSVKDDRYYYHRKETNEVFISSDRQSDGFEKLLALSVVYAPREYQILDPETGKKITVFDSDTVSSLTGKEPDPNLIQEVPKKPINFVGTILDEDGAPVPADIMFVFKRDGVEYTESIRPDKNGKFQKSLPFAVQYDITVNAEGYFMESQIFRPKNDADTAQINFVLKRMELKKVFVFNNIQYAFNSSILKPESFPVLNEIALTLINNPQIKVEISGHTCNMGSARYNQWLSDRRAKSVVDYLINKGVEAERLVSIGKGLKEPIADNATDAGRIQNRRTEVKVIE